MTNSVLNWALRQSAKKLSVSEELVEQVYKSYWKFIEQHISSIPLTDLSQEEFDSRDTNFNIPYIGKLYVEYDAIEKYRRKLNYYQNVKAKKSKASRLSGVSD